MKFNSEASVKNYKDNAGRLNYSIWDENLPGFGFRVQAGGSKVYYAKYRVGDKQRMLKIGRVDKLSLGEAIKKAKAAFSSVADSIDPANLKRQAAAGASQTFNPAFEGYLAKLELERSASYHGQAKMYLETHFKPLHGMALTAIDRKTVSDQLKIIGKRGPTTMNRARSTLSAFFNWAIREGFEGLENNPAHMTNKNKEEPRDRDFSNRELKKIWHGAPDNDFGHIVKLLMLTMQRRDEIACMPTKEFNRAERQIEIAAERSKNGNASKIPLSDEAFAILDKHYDKDRKFMFGSNDTGYAGWTKSKARLDETIRLNDHWTFHDFRRAGKTVMEQELEVPDNVSEAILNHSKKGLAKVYNGATYVKQKRDALDKYAAHLMNIIG